MKKFYDRFIKPLIDKILSLLGLIILSPVFLILSIAVVIDDPGPVFFTQKRVARGKKYFKLHKFRSMKMSTPHDTPTHLLENPEQYITRVGRFLRKSSLDELPQIWDIFVGNMSIIGPRPALWNQDDLIAERDKYGANDVKPGLTGWAQINGRDELEIEVKAKLDGEYVERESFLFDLRCFFGTIFSVLRGDGVVEGGTGEMNKEHTLTIAVLSSHTPSLFWFRMEMMKSFIERGCKVYALGNEPSDKWSERFTENGISYIQIDVNRNGVNPLNDIKTLSSIKKAFSEIKPDKVFTYQAKTVIYGGIAAKKLKIREVYPLIAGIGSVFLKNDIKTRFIRCVMVFEYRLGIKNCAAVFFQNRDDERVFRKFGIIKRQKVVLIPGSGVDTEKFAVTSLPEKMSFLCVSRLIRDKGVCEFLDASRAIKMRYPEVRCMLVGPFDSNPSAIKPEELQPFIDDGSVEYFGLDKVNSYPTNAVFERNGTLCRLLLFPFAHNTKKVKKEINEIKIQLQSSQKGNLLGNLNIFRIHVHQLHLDLP